MKHSEFPDPIRVQEYLEEINRDSREILLDSLKETTRYLLLINSGSAIALLTYMGNSEAVRTISNIWVSLSLFCFGIASIGCLLIYSFWLTRNTVVELTKDTQAFYNNEISYSEFTQRRPPIKTLKWPNVFGGISFACFIFGFIVAISSLFPRFGHAQGSGATSTASPPQGTATGTVQPNRRP